MRGRFGVTVACSVLLTIANVPTAFDQPFQRINTCFEESIAALRLNQLDQLTELCDKVINNASTRPELRGQALAQRGLAHFRRWAVLEASHDATRGIADITDGLRLHTPAMERKHQLLVIRAQLLGATGQFRRAADDYRLVLSEDPGNDAARLGLRRIGAPESN
jgi:tetratricopeptide (TPR) repeat protein